MIDFDKGNRIRLYELLYSQYSERDFTRMTDRPVAISGLEKRLIRTLDTPGGNGILDKYLGRGLLWQRSSPNLLRIPDLPWRIPSWSWMAYEGGIQYMNIPFGEVEWNIEIISPFTNTPVNKANMWYTGNPKYAEIRAPVRKYAVRSRGRYSSPFVFDNNNFEKGYMADLRCIVVGSQKKVQHLGLNQHRKHYVLLVRPAMARKGVYERVGVGTLETQEIDFRNGSQVRIQ